MKNQKKGKKPRNLGDNEARPSYPVGRVRKGWLNKEESLSDWYLIGINNRRFLER